MLYIYILLTYIRTILSWTLFIVYLLYIYIYIFRLLYSTEKRFNCPAGSTLKKRLKWKKIALSQDEISWFPRCNIFRVYLSKKKITLHWKKIRKISSHYGCWRFFLKYIYSRIQQRVRQNTIKYCLPTLIIMYFFLIYTYNILMRILLSTGLWIMKNRRHELFSRVHYFRQTVVSSDCWIICIIF